MGRLIRTVLILLCMGPLAFAQQLSVKDFLKLSPSDTTSYVVKGVVSKIRSSSSGSFYLQDATGTLLVYGIQDPKAPERSFKQLDIVQGDTLTVLGRFTIYGGTTKEMKDGRLIGKANGPDHNLSFYDRLDQKPSFKGKAGKEGLAAFQAWVQDHLKKPADGAKGSVKVRFVVGRNGGVQEVQVEPGGTAAMTAEVKRVMQSAPKWKPAIAGGSPVRMNYSIYVTFK